MSFRCKLFRKRVKKEKKEIEISQMKKKHPWIIIKHLKKRKKRKREEINV